MSAFLKKIIALILLSFILGCSNISHKYPDGDFRIIVLTDIHIKDGGSRAARLTALVNDINNDKYPGVELLVTCGDNVSSIYKEYYPDSSYKGDNRLQRFLDVVSSLKIPYYLTLGNHEYKIEHERDSDGPYAKEEILRIDRIWKEMTGHDPYYSKVFRGWKLLILNSMSDRHVNRKFSQEQLDWLENELDSTHPTLIFFHHPLRTDNFRFWGHFDQLATVDEEPRFFSIVKKHKKNIKGIFVGHGHTWTHDKLFKQIDVYETMSFGDDEESPFLVIGLGEKNGKINVGRTPLEHNN